MISTCIEFLKRVNGGEGLPDAELANMRTAYSEAKAVVVYDMKKKFDTSSTESASSRQVPAVELASRA
eukprot:660397-Amphidinium_carterae.1